ncbi:ergothioneine biosynthesis glutamate--cysteine ligase EgtA [Mycolicibacterium monacense]|uniref:Glutamate--cysteine ligase EgtA n=4 Tax=Mycobacteriaceae TaxID=1762 RepID=A0AAD1J418_MYCMB|nr:ergothioneine biosynthesis glutamate--cysteine ligase EgtA [Mycolicibacterium monacense]MDA4105391.1 glutamate--cysteine ligase [Mycolicibacterium monacense DSM 44395]OBB54906.1 ergothioneine biosynthesis glutamate--cysteine ligase EgtA [Mycolicibacterium monacense]OBF48283.1 ergothioneine biosynthesis glutamate--cysteine ligase EgtA [Mycolicibacterium monacense]ORB15747.1 ergothioneine biosynthesis glutamate--cysteine ligase EgtA [Mycolicibacterium monacense DSM 44395]QHP88596.1 ergothione
MTVPTTYDPGCDTAPDEFASAADAAEHITEHCLHDGPVGQVGLEVEAHSFDLADPRRRPDWGEVTDAIAGVGALPGGSRITVEPGGAVELSGPPADGSVAAIAAMTSDRAVLRTAFAQRGLGLVLVGADPLRRPRRVNPGGRYSAMEAFFTASGTGAAGAFMMTSTASIQLNLDAGPRRGWADRVRLAHALGPTMIAATANSPLLAGRFSGWQSSRQWVWGELDEARCGPVLGASGDDPASDWARYALRAPVMLVHNPEPVPVTDWVPFAEWADGQTLLGGRRPTRSDLEYHLTTLFPPVRPRRWLEIRYLDAVSDALWPAVAFTLTTLLDDPAAADIAAEATESVATAWDRAARIGLGDRRLHAAALRCVETAAERAPAAVMESMQQLVRSVEEGRSPADDFADRAVAYGIGPAVRQLAKGES